MASVVEKVCIVSYVSNIHAKSTVSLLRNATVPRQALVSLDLCARLRESAFMHYHGMKSRIQIALHIDTVTKILLKLLGRICVVHVHVQTLLLAHEDSRHTHSRPDTHTRDKDLATSLLGDVQPGRDLARASYGTSIW